MTDWIIWVHENKEIGDLYKEPLGNVRFLPNRGDLVALRKFDDNNIYQVEGKLWSYDSYDSSVLTFLLSTRHDQTD